MKCRQQQHSGPRLARAAAVCALGLLAACGGEPPPPADEPVLATVGEETITVAEFERELRERGRRRPGQFAEAGQREQLLEEMIQWRALVAEARQRDIHREPEMRRMIERLLVQRLREDRISAALQAVEISDEEVAEFYASHRDEFARPARVQGAIVYAAAAAEAGETAREAARKRIQEALAASEELPDETVHFGAVAREYSDDRASRYQGGVIGWLVERPGRAYRWDAAVVDALFALETPGDIAPVIETDDGFYLVRLIAREPSQSRPLDKVADGIRHRLLRQRRAAIEEDLVETLTAGRQVQIDRELLHGIEPPETVAAEPPPSRSAPPALPGGAAAEESADTATSMENDHE